MTEKNYQDAVQVLKDHLGGQWQGLEQDGRDEMVEILQNELGYDRHVANNTIDTMIQIGQLRYHRTGEDTANQDTVAGDLPLPAALPVGGAGTGIAGGGMSGAPIAPVLGLRGGHWEIGGGEAQPPGRAGQITPS